MRDIEPDKTGLRCPDWDQGPLPIGQEPLGGCGSTNILWDGEVWDCLDCGLFFTTEAGTPPDGTMDIPRMRSTQGE